MDMDFYDWRDYGIDKGWISSPTCYFHDGLPLTEEEEIEIDEHDETCISISRFYNERIGGDNGGTK